MRGNGNGIKNPDLLLNMQMEGEDDVTPPGFRFHPTDEELVRFYLTRKVQNKPIRLQLIAQADIYKFDPWDLPKSSLTGDNEWYFFCRRGRKYKNSIRPNRVTGSGFWKATGIDKPVRSCSGGARIIGLKKSLVYYRGRAGKGTKTEWMMHEFRLPDDAADKTTNPKNIYQEAAAEVWTLCRILKRNTPNRRYGQDWRRSSVSSTADRKGGVVLDACSDTCSLESRDQNGVITNFISFDAPAGYTRMTDHQAQKPYNPAGVVAAAGLGGIDTTTIPNDNQESILSAGQVNSTVTYEAEAAAPSAASSFSSYITDHNNNNRNDEALLQDGEDWEDLRSVVNCAAANHYCSFYW